MTGWGSAALLLAAVLVGTLPAYGSSPADLAVRISGEATSEVPGGHVLTATVVNRGPGRASGVQLRFSGQVDSEAMDPESLHFCRPRRSHTPPAVVPSLTADIHGTCPLPDLAPGHSHGLRSVVLGRANMLGTVGRMTVVVGHAGVDPAPADNSAATSLGAAESAADSAGHRLYVRGWDGPADPDGTIGAVPPGGVGDLRFEVGNSGDAPVNGLTVTIRLPQGVTFAGVQPGCGYARDRRSATCVYGDLPLLPADRDTDPDDRRYSALLFRHGFEVDSTAPTQTRLDDGLLRVEPMVTGYLPPPVTRLPADVTGTRARDFAAEADQDRFAIRTGASVGDGAGKGDSAVSPDGLPVTGVSVGSVGLAGLGLAGAGAALLLLARRRGRRSTR